MKQNLTVGALLCAAIMLVFGFTQADAQSATDDPAQVEAGKAVFETNCAGCHGTDGTGVSGRGRSLIGIASQEADRSVHFMSITNGKGGMPAFGDQLSDEERDAAISYVRLTFVEAPAAATTAADDDAAASDDSAATTELAVTGTETQLFAIGGVTLLAAGALMVHYGRRQDD